MAFSRIFWSAASFLSMSAHCARGICQNPTYEYIGGFSLTSGICAPAGAAQTAAIASAHSPAKTLPNFLFIIFILLSSQDFHFAILCHGSVHLGTRIWGCPTLRGFRGWVMATSRCRLPRNEYHGVQVHPCKKRKGVATSVVTWKTERVEFETTNPIR